ncbi:serine protease [Phenylobacterium sp.]|uniref:trypsin-like serine peptidase n=1 Tax=Phenylobacterium sp. TaxID=1871053 RepID=UPI002F4258D3
MSVDISAQLIQATVQVEQALPDGSHIIGTGFLVSDPTADGKPRTVLVTANHVLNRMTGAEAHIGYRFQGKDGGWRYDPRPIVIRSRSAELWSHNPNRDVAAIVVKAPAEFAKSAIPLDWLAGGDTFAKYAIGPGDEMMVLGYPQGLSADSAGFPILRSGRVASPIDAPSASPTFLLDFRVFPGNSGGPVFISQVDRHRPGTDQAENVQFVAGMLTQQVELNDQRLEIGIVTDATFIRDAIALLDKPRSHGAPAMPDAPAASPDVPVTVTDAAANTAAAANIGTAVGD